MILPGTQYDLHMKAMCLPLLLFTLAGPDYSQAQLPSFEQFQVTEIYSGKPAAPQIKTAGDRQFRTRIREGAAKGPNFAGHLTVARWGCGSGCISMAIIDAQTGAIYRSPFSSIYHSLGLRFGGKHASGEEKWGLSFTINSRLLIARGCQEEENCGSYFYEWTGMRLKLIRKVAAVRED